MMGFASLYPSYLLFVGHRRRSRARDDIGRSDPTIEPPFEDSGDRAGPVGTGA
jgi:hypothetical protein